MCRNVWTSIFGYMSGLDIIEPIPTAGKSDAFKAHARTIIVSLDKVRQATGEKERLLKIPKQSTE